MPTDSFLSLPLVCVFRRRVFRNLFLTMIVEISEAEFYMLTVGAFQVAYIVLMKVLAIRMVAR